MTDAWEIRGRGGRIRIKREKMEETMKESQKEIQDCADVKKEGQKKKNTETQYHFKNILLSPKQKYIHSITENNTNCLSENDMSCLSMKS